MSAPRTGTPIVLSSLAILVMLCAAAVGCTQQPSAFAAAGGQTAQAAAR